MYASHKNFHAFLCSDKLEQMGAEDVNLSSTYIAHDRSAPPEELQHFMTTIAVKKLLQYCSEEIINKDLPPPEPSDIGQRYG